MAYEKNHESRNFTRSCGAVLSEIEVIMGNIKDFNTNWFQTNGRVKRGAFNIVGNVLNSLFGTLSQEDAQQYLHLIGEMEHTEEETKLIVDKQTTLIKSTSELLDKYNKDNIELYSEMNNQFKTINETLNILRIDYENIWLTLEAQFQMENLLLLVSLFLTSFHNKQRQFLEALSLLSNKHSQNPIILPPQLFIEQLLKIEEEIKRKNLKLPLDVNTATLPYFYQIASTRSRILDNQLLISMTIPLVNLDEFELIKITSVPHTISEDLYGFIVPQHEYLAIDSLRERFISFSNGELENCYDLRYRSQNKHLICMQSSPIFQISSSTNDCAINVLLGQNYKIGSCDIRVSNITSQVWLQLREINAWIYVFPKEDVIYIRCDSLPTVQKLLEGTGIIRMKENCHIKTKGTKAHTVFSTDIYEEVGPTFIPQFDFNLTNHLVDLKSELKFKQLDSPQIISFGESNKLRDISNGIEELQNFKRTKLANKNNQQRNYIYLLISFFTITVLFTIHCLWKHKCFEQCYECKCCCEGNVNVEPDIELDSYFER